MLSPFLRMENNMVKNKERPFMGFSKLVDNLTINHNIIVKDKTAAERILMDHSYYALVNGYQRALEKSPNSEMFRDGITIEMLQRISLIEADIATTLLQSTLDIEKKLRTGIQYVVTKHFGTDWHQYLNQKNYISPSQGKRKNIDRVKVTNKLKGIATGYTKGKIGDERNRISDGHASKSLKDFRKLGTIPPWILVNDVMFGSLILWYKILQPQHKEEVLRIAFSGVDLRTTSDENFQSSNFQFFSISLDILREYRNGFAHGDVLNKIAVISKLDLGDLKKLINDDRILTQVEYERNIGKKDLLSLMLIITLLAPNYRALATLNRIKGAFGFVDQYIGTLNSSNMRRVFRIPDNFIKRLDYIEQEYIK